MSQTSGLYIGLMSGTSADGIDAVLVDFSKTSYKLITSHSSHYDSDTQQVLKSTMQAGAIDLDTLGKLDIAIGAAFAKTVTELLEKNRLDTNSIIAIGSHGQTIRHLPPTHGAAPARGFSMQLGDPSTIAADTNIDVIADFRQADMAQGGHGAPLAPAFHRYAFDSNCDHGVLNLGGIANITVCSNGTTTAWDTGPASTLMDAWINRHQQQPYDNKGQWAKTGTAHQALLNALLKHPYFSLPAPKSTGFETFNLRWLDDEIIKIDPAIEANDIQATLLELTAQTICDSVSAYNLRDIFICGGGVNNTLLMTRLKKLLPRTNIQSSSVKGIDPQCVEAMAFAWLAWRYKQGLAGNMTGVTGAQKPVILGGFYPSQK